MQIKDLNDANIVGKFQISMMGSINTDGDIEKNRCPILFQYTLQPWEILLSYLVVSLSSQPASSLMLCNSLVVRRLMITLVDEV